MIGDKNVNNAKKMSEYRVKVNVDVKIALYIDEVYCNVSSAIEME